MNKICDPIFCLDLFYVVFIRTFPLISRIVGIGRSTGRLHGAGGLNLANEKSQKLGVF